MAFKYKSSLILATSQRTFFGFWLYWIIYQPREGEMGTEKDLSRSSFLLLQSLSLILPYSLSPSLSLSLLQFNTSFSRRDVHSLAFFLLSPLFSSSLAKLPFEQILYARKCLLCLYCEHRSRRLNPYFATYECNASYLQTY